LEPINRILAINPGSTSTKLAVYENENEIFLTSVSHLKNELEQFSSILDQRDFRIEFIESVVGDDGIDMESMDGIGGRGGLLKPVPSGTYIVNQDMLDDLIRAERGEHACNLGGIIAFHLAQPPDIPAFVVDPVVVDEMAPIARISGIPELERQSKFHALNQKAVARQAAEELKKKYEDLNLIVVHMGGGISIGVHEKGKVIDVNNAFNGDGPFAPERAGSVPTGQLVDLCFSGKWTREAMKKRVVGNAGMVAYLGTNDIRKCKEMISAGNSKAKMIYEAMTYQIAKDIGSGAAVLRGKVDAIVLTGGVAYDEDFVTLIRDRVEWIGNIFVYPGEREMQALAQGCLRVLRGEEEAKVYSV